MIDVFLVLILAALFALAAVILISNKRKGRCLSGCGGDCASCARRGSGSGRTDSRKKEV